MSNFKKLQDQQTKIAEAVKAINHHFHEKISYAQMMEDAAVAQQEIIGIMDVASRPISGETCDIPEMDHISTFLWEVMRAFRLLKPFADLQGQIYGTDD